MKAPCIFMFHDLSTEGKVALCTGSQLIKGTWDPTVLFLN